MSKVLITPKNWEKFQHYKHRNPPWVKLHKELLDDCEFQRLPDASRALAPMLWLLASESDSATIDASPQNLSFRLRMTEKQLIEALNPLISIGKFIIVEDASNALATCAQSATTEKSRVEKSKVEILSSKLDDVKFILDYLNKKTGRKYKPVNANLNHIKARLMEYSKDELINMIDHKSDQWLTDETMNTYLRPATLFNATKCAQYIGEIGTTGKQQKPWFLIPLAIAGKGQSKGLDQGDKQWQQYASEVLKAYGVTKEEYQQAKQLWKDK